MPTADTLSESGGNCGSINTTIYNLPCIQRIQAKKLISLITIDRNAIRRRSAFGKYASTIYPTPKFAYKQQTFQTF